MKILIAAALGASTLVSCNQSPPAKPNIVFVMLDDARPDEMTAVADLRPDGGFAWVRNRALQVPRLQMTNNLCCPGRATALTGQTSYNHGVATNRYKHLPDVLPSWLKRSGYCTGFVGKFMNGYGEARARPPGWTYWEPLTGAFDDETGYSMMHRDGTVYQPGVFQTDHLGAVSRGQLQDCAGPTFLAFWPFAPHFGADPNAEYVNTRVSLSIDDPAYNEADISDKPAWMQDIPLASDGRVASFQELHVQTLLSVDDQVKALINELTMQGKINNTVIVLTSDNGLFLGEHRMTFNKKAAYEAGQPTMWIAGSGFIAGVTDAFVTNLDVAPTLSRVAGLRDRSSFWDGEPIQDVLVTHGQDRFLPIRVPDASGSRNPHPAGDGVRTGRYKYVLGVDGSEELYDVVADPYELENRVTDPTYLTVKTQMAALLIRAKGCQADACRIAAPRNLQ